MDSYLLEQQVQCTLMHPLRQGIAGQLYTSRQAHGLDVPVPHQPRLLRVPW